jgi:predicted transcriptional regulator
LFLADIEDILISVEHKYVVSILSGKKKVELRRRPIRVPPGTRVWIYSKAPHAVVAAVATVGSIVSASPIELWRKHGALAGVTKGEFDAYFSDASTAWGIFLNDICALPSVVTLAALRTHSTPFHPPQFFMKLRHGSGALDLLRGSLHGTYLPQSSFAF